MCVLLSAVDRQTAVADRSKERRPSMPAACLCRRAWQSAKKLWRLGVEAVEHQVVSPAQPSGCLDGSFRVCTAICGSDNQEAKNTFSETDTANVAAVFHLPWKLILANWNRMSSLTGAANASGSRSNARVFSSCMLRSNGSAACRAAAFRSGRHAQRSGSACHMILTPPSSRQSVVKDRRRSNPVVWSAMPDQVHTSKHFFAVYFHLFA